MWFGGTPTRSEVGVVVTAGVAGVPGGPAPALKFTFLATQTNRVVGPI